ncbi:alpha- and gamma-adaptin-binding protein p34-like [Dendronephthya gigantea]|uniref:alpha- and gamma-adaptin-binding protein p34-like n=1 Tax=Dendronephthya gigantea TaxID=151771 RepID=UPI00106A3C98|nr:alpha- and gamma-adaptin-binding protein p34-like [Dendronephthya gigantea]
MADQGASLDSAENDKKDENYILVINCCECMSSQEFIQQIVQDECPAAKSMDGFSYYPWRIKNKYYCADVRFVAVSSQNEKPDWLSGDEAQITAVVILFDQTQLSFEVAKAWQPCVESQDASVLLLVGTKSRKTDTNNDIVPDISTLTSKFLEFSIKHSFEFIDLNEEEDPEDDFMNTVGFERIVQALHATEWPSLEMKEQEAKTGSTSESTSSGNDDSRNGASENKTADISQTGFETFHDMFDGIIDEADLDNETSFDKLFSQMRLMKEKAENLPHTERKAYAEKVAVAFWKAIGGDEDEIGDLNKD